jgi:hypothetical protein
MTEDAEAQEALLPVVGEGPAPAAIVLEPTAQVLVFVVDEEGEVGLAGTSEGWTEEQRRGVERVCRILADRGMPPIAGREMILGSLESVRPPESPS